MGAIRATNAIARKPPKQSTEYCAVLVAETRALFTSAQYNVPKCIAEIDFVASSSAASSTPSYIYLDK